MNPKKKPEIRPSLWKINKNRGEIWKRFKLCVQDWLLSWCDVQVNNSKWKKEKAPFPCVKSHRLSHGKANNCQRFSLSSPPMTYPTGRSSFISFISASMALISSSWNPPRFFFFRTLWRRREFKASLLGHLFQGCLISFRITCSQVSSCQLLDLFQARGFAWSVLKPSCFYNFNEVLSISLRTSPGPKIPPFRWVGGVPPSPHLLVLSLPLHLLPPRPLHQPAVPCMP